MKYEYWLSVVQGISNRKKKQLREMFSSAEELFFIEEKELMKISKCNEKEVKIIEKSKQTEWEKGFEEMNQKGIQMMTIFNNGYPEKIRQISDPPYALYFKGELPDEMKKSVAIVGARQCSPYGELMALEYGEVLAKSGVQIISGMARGIDSAGHRGALKGGKSFAVLGCGVDICYPKENRGLYIDLQAHGGVISEFPPGVAPKPMYFPMRNRIISGLSDYVLVMEAREKSGSLITADLALEQGKNVYALPGQVNCPLSTGCHLLIRQGADILISPEDLLNEMNISYIPQDRIKDKNKKVLERTNDMVYSCLGLSPKATQELMDETGLSVQKLLVCLTELQMEGMIKEISKNHYVRTKI